MTQAAADAFEEGDLRKAVTVYRPADEGATYDARYQDTGNYLAKTLPRLDGNSGQIADAVMNYNNNVRLYRFAETLLNAAELIAVHGCSGKAQHRDILTRCVHAPDSVLWPRILTTSFRNVMSSLWEKESATGTLSVQDWPHACSLLPQTRALTARLHGPRARNGFRYLRAR